jgi:translation initiation factor IF-3
VIGADGEQLGILRVEEALRSAEEQNLDLVEVSPKAVPPVCRIMDYGRFKYEQSKKTKAAKKHQTIVKLKEVKLRPKTDDHDFNFKMDHIKRFLQEGNKVKLVVVFRGREITHPEQGRKVLERVVQEVKEDGAVEQMPMMEGRRMLMIIGPRPGGGQRQHVPAPHHPSPSSSPTPAHGAAPAAPAASAPASAPAPAASEPAASAPAASAPAAPAPASAAPAPAQAPSSPPPTRST